MKSNLKIYGPAFLFLVFALSVCISLKQVNVIGREDVLAHFEDHTTLYVALSAKAFGQTGKFTDATAIPPAGGGEVLKIDHFSNSSDENWNAYLIHRTKSKGAWDNGRWSITLKSSNRQANFDLNVSVFHYVPVIQGPPN
jgi:hypothetical protein